ncbi:nephrin-like isoform X2 [Dreissena polymorpha]|uniref:nephrin-like isoform X2 n=1 Tax=Dreissena polymorpha TaxID=45954 RepID=UPI002263E907|nr:nephrin-like isoform X2 [Dreissena polymorpha]
MCEAQDDYDESSFYLDVQYAAKISRFHAVGFDVSSKSITINESKSVTLLCEVDSDPVAYLAVINTTRGSNHLLIGQHNNTISISLGRAQCEYDMGVYDCKGNNTHNKVQQVRTVEILINCAPRPSPFYPVNTTIYRKTNDSVILTFTFVAYPPPSNLDAFVWKKLKSNEWVTLQNSSGFFIHISNDRLQTNLSKWQLHSDDFTNYTVRVNNDIGSWEHSFVIRANVQPSAPELYEIMEDLVTQNSVTIEWKSGFDGGEEQRFVILYKKSTEMAWDNITLPGAITRIALDGLDPGTAYEVKMYAENTIGKSEETAVQHVVTKSYSVSSYSSTSALGGVVGGIFGVVVILAVSALIWRCRSHGLITTKQCLTHRNSFRKYEDLIRRQGYNDASTTDGSYATCRIDSSQSRKANQYETIVELESRDYSIVSACYDQRDNTTSAKVSTSEQTDVSSTDPEYVNLQI